MPKTGFVYLLASQRNGTLYVGVTSDLCRRVHEHRSRVVEGFTSKHRIHRLVYAETFNDILDAFVREKQLKRWNRAWKLRLIEQNNPLWEDLYDLYC